ncbi:4-(cytidine 5'-diphospho)-2-C-methyl-D-erythritol kinase [soil metagenome]
MSPSVPHPDPPSPADQANSARRWSGPAPAKVNLFLRVLAREESGYHQVETLFQALELADDVTLEFQPEPGAIRLHVVGVPPDALGPPETNLVVRAARLLLDAVGTETPGLRIHLVKRIPHGAGLGGGSSDAATVLRGLNELLGRPLEPPRLATLGGQLGADVPFFLCGSPLALAWGRGDRVLPLPPLPAADVLVALPEARISTPDAYARLAQWRAERQLTAAPARLLGEGFPDSAGATPSGGGLLPWSSWGAVARAAGNDFALALHDGYPELAAIRDTLERSGARPALLSGSGSAVFGVFPEGASGSGMEIETDGISVLRTRTLAGGSDGGTAPGPRSIRVERARG